MRAAIVGAGATGARAARQFLSLGSVDDLLVVDSSAERARLVAASLGEPARVVRNLADESLGPGDVVLLQLPGSHRAHAEAAMARGANVVSTADGLDEVRELLTLDQEARSRHLHVVVGAGFSPGLACVLTAFAARAFERIEEIHVAKLGTGGPACAGQRRRALRSRAHDWRDGEWEGRRGRTGRELCWFPDPLGGVDCFRAALPETTLLVKAFPSAGRVTARVGTVPPANLAERLRRLRQPPSEDELGAIRVEVRGAQGRVLDDRVLGAIDRPALAAGTVAALAARWAVDGRLLRAGAGGLAELVEPGQFLAALAERGVKVAAFEGAHYCA